MKAQAHKRKSRQREIRASKKGSAREAFGTIEKGCEIYCLTMGQFSFIDALVAIIEQTGPAHVSLATWTAANADLTVAAQLLENAQILSIRFIVDRSFLTRQPAYCQKMRDLFGDECIRTSRSHAKFATLRNDDWSIVVRTSMNLNHNPRIENIEISDDPELLDFMERVADAIFDEVEQGDFAAGIPVLDAIKGDPLLSRPRMGTIKRPLAFPRVGPSVVTE